MVIDYAKRDKDAFPDYLVDYLREICRYQMHIDQLPEDDYSNRIVAMSQLLEFVGEIVSYTAEDSKRAYNLRKLTYAQKILDPDEKTRNKQAAAEIAVAHLREEEAKCIRREKSWHYAYRTIEHEMNALKHKLKVSMADGSMHSC